MSFLINDINLQECNFNNQFVKKIYYNDVLVWANTSWPGWDNATWEDIYNLCKAKQLGAIADWPTDVVLGATKMAYCPIPRYSYQTAAFSTHEVMLIGMDIDGPGVLTFETKNCFIEAVEAGENAYDYLSEEDNIDYWGTFVGAMKQYIKPLNKQYVLKTHNEAAGQWDYSVYIKEVYTFHLSAAERGVILSGVPAVYTEGVSVPYPYFRNASTRIKKAPAHRTSYDLSTNYHSQRDDSYVTYTGSVVKTDPNNGYGYWGHYAFAIG